MRGFRRVRDVVIAVVCLLVVVFVTKTFLFESFYIPSASMEHTLVPGERIGVSRLSPSLIPLQRGDVVVFQDPGGWLLGDPNAKPNPSNWFTPGLSFLGLVEPAVNNHLVKRVVGLPGDTVQCCSVSKKLIIDGVPVSEPYIIIPHGFDLNGDAVPYPFKVKVPAGDVFVLGDNRWDSKDSAFHTVNKDATPFVPLKDVVGTGVFVVSPSGWGAWLGSYPNVFKNVLSSHHK